MTEQHHESAPAEPTSQPVQGASGAYAPQAYDHGASAPQAYAPGRLYPQAMGAGAVGKVRGTGVCILLAFVTFGIYSLFWYFKTHEEMKRHSGQGLGGGLALLLAFFVGIVMPYITSSEVGDLHERGGREKPVSGADRSLVLPGHAHPHRADRLVRQDQRRPQRLLALDGCSLTDLRCGAR